MLHDNADKQWRKHTTPSERVPDSRSLSACQSLFSTWLNPSAASIQAREAVTGRLSQAGAGCRTPECVGVSGAALCNIQRHQSVGFMLPER